VSRKAGLYDLEKRNNRLPLPEFESRIVQAVANYHTYYNNCIVKNSVIFLKLIDPDPASKQSA